jgi:hypothetical protein
VVLVQHEGCSPRRQGPARGRARKCLLKGCEHCFSPHHPLARYCSAACRQAARLWSRWRAARRYRASAGGQACRRHQACRYRERVRQRPAEAAAQAACEGHQEAADSEKIPCSRPGCYELFPRERRSPLQKFCCALCREALRRVRQREARWQSRFPSLADDRGHQPFHGPSSDPVQCRILPGPRLGP